MFVDVSGASPREQNKWPSIVIPKEDIDLEIARLIDAPRPDNGRRASLITHPQATAPGLGLAPGTDVTINVVNPGERTYNLRKNSNMLEICISGEGIATVAGRDIRVGHWDVWKSWKSITSRSLTATCRLRTPTPAPCRPAPLTRLARAIWRCANRSRPRAPG